MQPAITMIDLKKRFDNDDIFDDISFEVKEGQIVAIVGPNGCGKSTILNILSGIIEKYNGKFIIHNFDFLKFSYIFQNYRDSILPWKNNYDNIIFPLKLQKWKKQDIIKKMEEINEIFGIIPSMKAFPYEMSGGQQQILALMRALVNNPEILFMDEPFSALDYETTLNIRKNFQKYYLRYKPTVIIITHNIEEAVQLANKIIVLSKKPSRMISVISNTAPYPRDIEFLKSAIFNKIKARVLTAFQKGANLC